MNLSNHIDMKQLVNRSSFATTTSTGIDLANCEGCLFIASLSTLAEGSSRVSLNVKGSTVSTTGGFVGYGPSQYVGSTAIATNSNNYRVLVADLYKPTKRYASVTVTGASSGAIYLNSIIAVKYGVRKLGSTAQMNSTTVAGSTILISPTSS